MSSNNNRSHTNPTHITFLTDQAKTDHEEAVTTAMQSLQSSGSDETLSSVQQVGAYAWNGTNWERTQVDSSGSLNVNIVSGGGSGGDATAANQTTMIGHLSTIEGDTTSLDAKIISCNTGAVVVSSSALPSGGATSALQTAGNASLTSIDGKVTTCDTGNVSGSVSVSNNTDPATATLQTAGNASLTELEGSLYADGDAIGVSDKGVLIMGRNGTNSAKPIHITNNGDVEVEIADFTKGQAVMASSFPVVISSDQSTLDVKQKESENLGSANNLANNVTINAGATSSSVSVSAMRVSNLVYEDSATSAFDGLDIEISVDGGSTFHEGFAELFPTNNLASTKRVSSYMDLSVAGITHIRLRNTSTTDNYTNVNATIVGCP